jgi:hypothetical protein
MSMNALLRIGVVACLACTCPLNTLPGDTPVDSSGPVFQVGVDHRREGQWRHVGAQTVFRKDDEIRFRFRTSLGGYLYVLNLSSDGQSTWLFPRPERGESSRVEPGPLYLIPGTKGVFVVGGKPGFDITYWIESPVPIDTGEVEGPAPGSQPNTLVPRCREEVLQARGLCEDERAGPQPLASPEHSPVHLPGNTTLVARDLKFHTEAGSTSISAPKTEGGVIVYEFRIAHN